jgi:D-alanyl-D-alanine carboxypeptidase (penicillin-binding protein 5/6)
MKKILSVMVAICLLFMQVTAMAMAESAECACVINALTGEVVFSKNPDMRHSMASTTKIMTAVIALERSGADEIVTVSDVAAAKEGSSAYLSGGDEIKMSDLLYGLMLNSGNDAAAAVAEHIAGGESEFADLMNEKAAEIGLSNTHFSNPSGLDDDEHYTTARDMANLAAYAMKNEKFREIVSAPTHKAVISNTGNTLYFSNHNKMIELYDGATGIKTGYTKKTGRCLVSSAKRDNMEFIAVTLNSPNDWNEHAAMLDYAFSLYYPRSVVEKNSRMKCADINGKRYFFSAADSFFVPMKKDGSSNCEAIIHMAQNINAPINKGEKAGYVEIKYNGKNIGSVDIVSEEDISGEDSIEPKNEFFGFLIRFFQAILRF